MPEKFPLSCRELIGFERHFALDRENLPPLSRVRTLARAKRTSMRTSSDRTTLLNEIPGNREGLAQEA